MQTHSNACPSMHSLVEIHIIYGQVKLNSKLGHFVFHESWGIVEKIVKKFVARNVKIEVVKWIKVKEAKGLLSIILNLCLKKLDEIGILKNLSFRVLNNICRIKMDLNVLDAIFMPNCNDQTMCHMLQWNLVKHSMLFAY